MAIINDNGYTLERERHTILATEAIDSFNKLEQELDSITEQYNLKNTEYKILVNKTAKIENEINIYKNQTIDFGKKKELLKLKEDELRQKEIELIDLKNRMEMVADYDLVKKHLDICRLYIKHLRR